MCIYYILSAIALQSARDLYLYYWMRRGTSSPLPRIPFLLTVFVILLLCVKFNLRLGVNEFKWLCVRACVWVDGQMSVHVCVQVCVPVLVSALFSDSSKVLPTDWQPFCMANFAQAVVRASVCASLCVVVNYGNCLLCWKFMCQTVADQATPLSPLVAPNKNMFSFPNPHPLFLLPLSSQDKHIAREASKLCAFLSPPETVLNMQNTQRLPFCLPFVALAYL